MTHLAAALAISLSISTGALAQTTWFVDDDSCPGPGDGTPKNPFCSIQDAIDAASDGDTVIVSEGTYNETLFLGKAITVRSTDPENPSTVMNTIIDGDGAGTVVLFGAVGPDTVLNGFLITGGSGDPHGGGLLIQGSDVSPHIRNCSISGNAANGSGGGVWLSASTPTFTNCSFSGNSAGGGGAVEVNSGGPATFEFCHFISNTSLGGSAGIDISSNGQVILNSCTFRGNNNEGGFGGAIRHVSTGPMIITGCVFEGNSAATGAGAIRFNDHPKGISTMTGCSFCNNTPETNTGTYNDGGGNTINVYCPPPIIPSTDPCPGDTNNDGVVDVTDLLNLLAAWGPCII